MKRIFLIAFILFLHAAVFAQTLGDSIRAYENIFKKFSFKRFNDFNTEVLNGGVGREKAVKMIDSLEKAVIYYEAIKNDVTPLRKSWVFPLQGYDYHTIGGTNGNGYSDKGYYYLDGNKHLAHPAHDIFIRDKNQDGIDDKTNHPVNVLAIDDGVVIACTNEWANDSNLRGGRFIWIYHPQGSLITYYAHNREIFVKPGDRVKQGQKIAEVGRTGLNAYPKRSPTHLHFSAFHIINGLPVPFNPYTELKKAIKQ